MDLDGPQRRPRRVGWLAVLLALVTIAALPSAADAAEFGIVPGSFQVRMLDAAGDPQYLAGSHPDRLQIDFALNVEGTGTTAREFVFELPPGFGSSPGAVPECPRELFEKAEEECPAESQIGVLAFGPPESKQELPIFQVEPGPGELVAFGSKPGFDVPMEMELRPADYGITFRASDLPAAEVSQGQVELWGVPADRQQGTSIPRRPFLTTPTRCEPLSFAFRTRSWQPDAPLLSATAQTEPLAGCDALPFAPRLGLQLTNPVADSPTGARIELELPQQDDPDGRATAQLRGLAVRLPSGVTVSPGGATGLTACSDTALGLGSSTPASCPAASRIGGVELASPLLDTPLHGHIHLGEERPGERFRLFVVASGPGLAVKSVGALRADPATGMLSMAVEDLPQVPLARLTMTIDGGPGALLASPLECGPAAGAASFEPYSGQPPAESTAAVSIAGNALFSRCPGAGPFAPTLTAASSNPRAGRSGGLSMEVRRRDGEQLPRRLAMTLPAGFGAGIGGLELCPAAAAEAGRCPAASRVGGAVASVGSGPQLAVLAGDAHLTGPYRGAPFGLALSFGGGVGPFDLGRIAVRAALTLARGSARLTVTTDQLPAVVGGVAIRFRTIGLAIDRPRFLRNPTSCRVARAEATLEAMSGAAASASSALAVRRCARLGFRPRIAARLTGRTELHRGGNPGLRIFARMRKGDTNLRAMKVALPRILEFDLSAVEEICARRAAVQAKCPEGARVGRARVRTPILNVPLRGSAYVVQPPDDGLPDLWLRVAALGVEMDLKGEASTRRGRLTIGLAGLPDLPLSVFSIRMPQGEGGILSLAARPCFEGKPRELRSRVAVRGQNGRQRRFLAPIGAGIACGRPGR